MPRVPVYDSPQVAPNVPQVQNLSLPGAVAPTPAMDAAGRQAQKMGDAFSSAGSSLGQIAADMAKQANQSRIDDFTNQAVKARTDLTLEAMQLQGRNALERPDGQSLPDEFSQKLRDQLASMRSALGNDAQRQAADHISARLQQQFYGVLAHHMLQQQNVYRVETQKATLDTAVDQASRLGSDEDLFQQSLGAIHDTVFRQVQENGGNEEMATAQFRKLRDATYYGRYKAWEQTDPVAALTNFQRNQAQISPIMRDRIAGDLFQSSASSLAQVAKPWVVGAGGAPVGSPDQGSTPRGQRNNNPGNIVQTADRWQGEVQGDDPKYKTFATPEAGIAAMGTNLLAYQDKYGLNTVSGIVSRWAPATDNNDTGSYIATVSKALGVKAHDTIDLHDADTMSRVVKAMIGVENGKQPYTDVQISSGINAALGKSALPAAPSAQAAQPAVPAWRDPSAKTGIPVIDALPPAQRAQVYSLAHSQMHQDMTQARDALTSRVNDTQAEYLATGTATNPPTETEFIQAYGQLDGVQRYQAFQDVATLGQKLQQTKTLSNANLLQLVNASKPTPGDGFAERERSYEILQRAVQQTIADRRKDPVKFALQNPAFGIQPVADFGNMNGLMTEVGKRKAVMDKIASDYGTPPALLTNEEAAAFGKYLDTLQTPDKARVLGNFAAVGGPAGARSLSAQLKDKNNTLAVAAMLSAYTTDPVTRWYGSGTPGANVGQMYLDGKDAIEQKRAKIDPQAEIGVKAQIYSALDGVYQTPQGRDAAAEAAYGIYGKLQADGKGDVNEAVRIATGGIMQYQGAKIAKPYGWDDGRFEDALADAVPRRIAAAGEAVIVSGRKVSAADFAKSLPGARLKTYGEGTYLVVTGNDVVRNPDGTPYVLVVAP